MVPRPESFPQSRQIHGAECSVVQSVAGAAAFAPDHAAVIRPHRTGEADVTQCSENTAHVHVTERRRMRRFVELTVARDMHIAAVREMNPTGQCANHRWEVIGWIGA